LSRALTLIVAPQPKSLPSLPPTQIALSGSEPAPAGVHLSDTFARCHALRAVGASRAVPADAPLDLFLSRTHSPLRLWTHE